MPRDSYVRHSRERQEQDQRRVRIRWPRVAGQTVEQNTGLRIDGYMEIGFGGFVNIIDALGGIDVPAKGDQGPRQPPRPAERLPDALGTDALGYVRMRKADPRVISAGLSGSGRCWPRWRRRPPRRHGAQSGALLEVNGDGRRDQNRRGHHVLRSTHVGLGDAAVSGGRLTLTVPVANTGASTPVGSAVLWDRRRPRRCSPTSPGATPPGLRIGK